MKKIVSAIRQFVSKNKGERWFKYTAIIAVLIAAAIAANGWREWQDSKDLPVTQETEETEESENVLLNIWDDSKAHFIVFGGLAVALCVVKNVNAKKLQEKR